MKRLLTLYAVTVALLFGAFSAFQQHQAQAGFPTLLGVGTPPVVSGGSTTTFDPVNIGTNLTPSNGNLTVTITGLVSGNYNIARSLTTHSTGIFYNEFAINNAVAFGDVLGAANSSATINNGLGVDNNSVGIYSDGEIQINAATIATVAGFAQGDTVGMIVDEGTQNIYFRTNGGNWNNSGTANPCTPTGGVSIAAISGGLFSATALHNTMGLQVTADFGAAAYGTPKPACASNW